MFHFFKRLRFRAFPHNEPSPIKQRKVVSSFLCLPSSDGKDVQFAIFKRSQQVNVYRGKWSVCTGSIEPDDADPEAAARREILEETKLTKEDISLLAQGECISVVDRDLNMEWLVYPFAWQLKEGALFSLDHEHTEFCFTTPGELRQYDHVPQLDITMRSVIRTHVG